MRARYIVGHGWIGEEPPSKFDPETDPAPMIADRDGRWALENNGRGHELPQLGRGVYAQSKGEAEALAEKTFGPGAKAHGDFGHLDINKPKRKPAPDVPDEAFRS